MSKFFLNHYVVQFFSNIKNFFAPLRLCNLCVKIGALPNTSHGVKIGALPQTSHCVKWGALCALLAICLEANLTAEFAHRLREKQGAAPLVHYKLIDLGTNDLTQEKLTRHQEGLSLGPTINNRGDIIGNRLDGGFIISTAGTEYMPAYNKAKYYFYDINNKGDILAAFERSNDDIQWIVWPTAENLQQSRLPIDTVEISGDRITLGKINDNQFVAGTARPDHNRSMPISWTPKQELYRLGFFQGINLFGTVQSLNNHDFVAGKSHSNLETFPYVWDGEKSHELFNLRRQFLVPSGAKIAFADLLINNDDILYGTYWINTDFWDDPNPAVKKYMSFSWQPQTQQFQLLDLDGMRFSAINQDRIVGSLHGEAAFANKGFKPIKLAAAMTHEEIAGWKLIEATDINDKGQIVGYGTKQGSLHLFLAEPL